MEESTFDSPLLGTQAQPPRQPMGRLPPCWRVGISPSFIDTTSFFRLYHSLVHPLLPSSFARPRNSHIGQRLILQDTPLGECYRRLRRRSIGAVRDIARATISPAAKMMFSSLAVLTATSSLASAFLVPPSIEANIKGLDQLSAVDSPGLGSRMIKVECKGCPFAKPDPEAEDGIRWVDDVPNSLVRSMTEAPSTRNARG